MSERAFKYHGLGNDFVILDRRQSAEDISPAASRALCDRHRGIGADGVLVLLPSRAAAARMVVHNTDGSIAEMCGNGLRCVVKYLADNPPEGAARRPARLVVETGAGLLPCDVFYEDGTASEVAVEMGPAMLVAEGLPSHASGQPFIEAAIPGTPGVKGTAVSMGNPHLVLFETPLSEAGALGPRLEHAVGFPQRTNVEFVALEPDGLTVVVWERGVGLTQACGTGACAAVAAGVRTGRVPGGQELQVMLPGGPLRITVAPDLSSTRLRGPARFVFEAVVDVPPGR